MSDSSIELLSVIIDFSTHSLVNVDPECFAQWINVDVLEFICSFLLLSNQNQVHVTFVDSTKCNLIYSSPIHHSIIDLSDFKDTFHRAYENTLISEAKNYPSGINEIKETLSLLPNAVSLSLLKLERIKRENPNTFFSSRILCITSSTLSKSIHQQLMNASFSAKKSNTLIDCIALWNHCISLHQAANNSGGKYVCLASPNYKSFLNESILPLLNVYYCLYHFRVYFYYLPK